MPKQKLGSCLKCKIPGFFIRTPAGGDYVTCPFCQSSVGLDDDDNEDFEYYYCEQCKVLFDLGCIHAEEGCTDSIFNALLMTGYTYQGQTHKGMLVFENKKAADEFQKLICAKQLQATFECSCPGKEYTCTKACYPRDPISCPLR